VEEGEARRRRRRRRRNEGGGKRWPDSCQGLAKG